MLCSFKIDGYFYQFIATTLGNLLTISYGMLFGITSAHLRLYQSEKETPLMKIITNNEASWITSYLCLGGILGAFIFCGISERFGRKISLLICGLIQIIGWFYVLFGYKIVHIYVSRFLVGIATGGSALILPIYITEISEAQWRGSLGTIVATSRNLGILVGFIISSLLSYETVAFIGLGTPVLFTLSFPFVQESPYYYVKNNNLEMIEKCLRYFRGIRSVEDRNKPEFMDEVERFKNMLVVKSSLPMQSSHQTNKKQQQNKITGKDFCNYSFLRIFLIGLVLITCTQFCGVFAILNYAETILETINNQSSPSSMNWSAILLAVMQAGGAYLGTLITDRINRKTLIFLSSLVTGLCLTTFGVFTFLDEKSLVNIDNLVFIELVFLSSAIITANLGLYPLGYVVTAEILPIKTKEISMTFFSSYSWVLSLLSVKFYFILVDLIGIYGCMWIFAGFCFFESLFVFLFMVETRGKSLEDIQKIFYT